VPIVNETVQPGEEEPTGDAGQAAAGQPGIIYTTTQRPRFSGIGSAITSRSAGWIVAAALAGSLVTLAITHHDGTSTIVLRSASAAAPAPVRNQVPAGGLPAMVGPSWQRACVGPAPWRIVVRGMLHGSGRHVYVQVVPSPRLFAPPGRREVVTLRPGAPLAGVPFFGGPGPMCAGPFAGPGFGTQVLVPTPAQLRPSTKPSS
jgi:hypothetical protein